MDFLSFAILIDMCVYALIGFIVAKVGRRWLPEPWNKPSMAIPVALAIGAIITLATLPRWFIWPH
ncbi:hypothetical protein DevBK_09775 [Devosia sp. BK]|uniref:hypothetical protein n=1 Tax=Devosia sp. BK TaxID=2871706 RepID=UPI00293A544C|nr:hypothetical protein [Devosia sp. BK]MDV3251619.1 hypothetical protein [Devosia sp. BK]